MPKNIWDSLQELKDYLDDHRADESPDVKAMIQDIDTVMAPIWKRL